MNDCISREDAIKKIAAAQDRATTGTEDVAYYRAIKIIREMPAVDAQPLSVVAEHIKNKLYNTAYYTVEGEVRNAIVDIAGRIDLWINELKDGETNG